MGEGYIFDAKTAKPLGKADGIGTTIEYKADALNVTVADAKPKVETVREVRIDYSETINGLGKSVSVETLMTFKELRKMVRELMEVN
jgi:hypothetical protein